MTAFILWITVGLMTALYGLHIQVVECGEISLADILVSVVCILTGPMLAMISLTIWLSENASNIVIWSKK